VNAITGTNGLSAAKPDASLARRERQARLMLRLVFSIAGLALALTILARLTGIGTDLHPLGAPIASHAVTIIETADKSVVFSDAVAGKVLLSYDAGRGGFFRSVLRAFALKRRAAGIAPEAPFDVTRWESGRITLSDPATGHRVPVDSFGPGVTRMFAPLVAGN
jgi:putative photosynthetic complex assembly protein